MIEARQAAIEADLQRDPYLFGKLAERAVLSIVQGDDAEVYLSGLRRTSPEIAEVLTRLAASPSNVCGTNGLYWLGRFEEGERERIEGTYTKLGEKLGTDLPALLIECSRQPDFPSFTHIVDEYFSYICFNASAFGSDPDCVIHEIAHAALFTRNRYLDEGIARYCESFSTPVDWEERIRVLRARQPAMPSIRALISYDASRDPYFEKLGKEISSAIHDHASLFIHAIVQRSSLTSLSELCRILRASTDRNGFAATIENFVRTKLEELDLSAQPTAANIMEDVSAATIDRIKRAMLRLDRVEIASCRQLLEKDYPVASPTLGPRALEAWCRIQLNEMLGDLVCGFIDEGTVAQVQSSVDRYCDKVHGGPLPSLFRALIGITYVALEDNHMAGMARMSQVRAQFHKALMIDRFDVDTLYQHARFVLLTPDEYQVGKDEAIASLRQLCRHSVYGSDVRAGIEKAGWLDKLRPQPAGA